MTVYKIFGKNIKIEYEDFMIKKYLEKWLNNYPKGDENRIDVNIKFVNELPFYNGNYYNSPTSYKVYDSVVFMNIGKHQVIFDKRDILTIYIKYSYKNYFLKNNFLKFRNIGYFNYLENIGAFFYEMILVFMQYILNDKVLIHSSAMKNLNTNEVFLFGGSGGVGKTSLELLLCKKLNFSFIADDISVVDEVANVYPNLAYPKIYAYNVVNNNEIKEIIFKNRNVLDKLQWEFMRKLKGENSVRRAVSPFELYKSVETGKNKITSYYILQKTNKVSKITITELDKKIASYATYLIIKNEYGNATIHYGWSEYNALWDDSIKPIIELDNVYDNWKHKYNKLFSNIDTYLIEIPINIKHNDFIRFFEDYFG